MIISRVFSFLLYSTVNYYLAISIMSHIVITARYLRIRR